MSIICAKMCSRFFLFFFEKNVLDFSFVKRKEAGTWLWAGWSMHLQSTKSCIFV